MHVLYISAVWPEPTSSAAGTRVMQILRACREAGWELSFGATAQAGEHSADLKSLGINCVQLVLNDSSFDQLAASLKPDIVVFDRFMLEEQFAMRVAEVCPGAVRVLDTIDLHFLRRARQRAVLKNEPLNLHGDDLLRELAAIYRSDVSLLVSDYELELLKNEFQVPEALLLYSPFMIDMDQWQPPQVDYAARQHFMMIGNFLHKPNSDAVRWCKKEIWPLIRKQLPDAECHVYGAYASDADLQLHDAASGFLLQGRCDDAIATCAACRVNLAPLRFGAGIKGKIADGWLAGTPTVTTAIGAEGMTGGAEPGFCVADDPASIAEAAVRLYSDEDAWCQMQQQGFAGIRRLFAADRHAARLITALNTAHAQCEQRRRANVIGAMLQQQRMKSTLYMSKWIEEKSRHAD